MIRQKGKASIERAKEHMIKDPNRAVDICIEVIEGFEGTDLWITGRAYAVAGRAFQNLAQMDSAISFYTRGLHAFNKADTNDLYTQYFVNRNAASLLNTYELFENAQEYYDRSLSFLGKYIQQYPELALKYKDIQKYHKVRYFSARNRLRYLGNPEGVDSLKVIMSDTAISTHTRAMAMNILGLDYKESGKTDLAIKMYSKMLALKNLSLPDKGMALHNLGGVKITSGKYLEAIEILDSAITVNSSLSDKRAIYVSIMDKGEAEMLVGHYSKAGQTFMQALKIDLEIAASEELFVIYHYLSIVMSNLKKPAEAEHWASLYRGLVKENLVTDSDDNFVVWQQRIIATQELTLKDLEHQDKLNLANKRGIWLVSLLVVLVVTLLYTIVIMRKRLLKKQRRKALELQQDITTVILSDISTEDLYDESK